MFSWNPLAFCMIQQMLAVSSLVHLPFQNPACTSGIFWFTYCWTLARRILSITFASKWNECNCMGVWTFFGISFLWDWNENCWVFQICWQIECSTFTASSFRIWNRSTGIPSLPLALFVVMFPKAHLTSCLGCLAVGEWSHHYGHLGHEDLFCVVLCVLATCS